jgi:hypothetical protein
VSRLARSRSLLAVFRLLVVAATPTPPVACFVDGLVVAVERETPLDDMLRVQAANAREQHKRALMEAAAAARPSGSSRHLPMRYGCPDPVG